MDNQSLGWWDKAPKKDNKAVRALKAADRVSRANDRIFFWVLSVGGKKALIIKIPLLLFGGMVVAEAFGVDVAGYLETNSSGGQ